jgi:hypothetical protein
MGTTEAGDRRQEVRSWGRTWGRGGTREADIG